MLVSVDPCSRDLRSARGFTLLEILFVVAITIVVAAAAVPVTDRMVKWARADSSVEFTMRQIAAARDRAIAERRNIRLDFDTTNNTIQIWRQEINGAGAATGWTPLLVRPGTTTSSPLPLENGQKFVNFSGVPDTPDSFGEGGGSATAFGGTSPFMFTSDGTLIDNNGDVVNGTVFTGMPGQPHSARAVTIFGVSGLMKTWKWREGQWMK